MATERSKLESKSFADLFVSGYKKEILEQLLDNPEYSFTVNEMTSRVSASYNTVRTFLRELERFELVSFRSKGGTYLVEYDRSSGYHDLIKSLLRADHNRLEEEAEKYAEKLCADSFLEDVVQSVVLFGSVARGTAGPGSDIDILVIVGSDHNVDRALSEARRAARDTESNYEIVPVVETVEEFERNLADGSRFESNIEKDGIVLRGGEELGLEN
jgi:Nucleotidyltransferase domain.